MAPVAQKKNLKMHKKLLLDVIKKQAGSLEKAILEGVMNAVEAMSNEVKLELIVVEDKAILTIKDDGIGITTEKELVEHFETFGTPHSEDENVIWKQFRMGRGQMFAFGYNTWRTSTFKMEVDIEKWGLTYHLTKNLPYVDGCDITIELYKNPIGGYTYPTIDSLKDSIRTQIEFVQTPIYFNGEQLSTPPQDLSGWTYEDENAYYLFNAGDGVKIYNLGAFVKKIDAYRAGTSGVIVSKKRLDVNFARNDIQSDCPVFEEIDKIIIKNRVNKATKKKYVAMTDYERYALLKDLRDAVQPLYNLKGKRIFKTAQGKWYSLNMILNNHQPWTFTPEGCRIADTVMENGQALCLSEDILNFLNYSGKRYDFFRWLLNAQRKRSYIGYIDKDLEIKVKLYIPYDEKELDSFETSSKCLTDGFSEEFSILPHNKLTIVEKRIIEVLQSFRCWDGRAINIGVSDACAAWTDGNSHITIERSFLRKKSLRYDRDIVRLFNILTHELAHDDKTDGSHMHGPQFYERFYEIIFSYDSPFVHATRFKTYMENAKMEEKKKKIIEKQKAKEKEIKNKLGVESEK